MSWISVNDKLPGGRENVLVAYQYGGGAEPRVGHISSELMIGNRRKSFWYIRGAVDGMWARKELDKISHWMPIPEMPDE